MIAVGSLRGSPGTTTTAMIAAQTIAARGIPTLLVEADCDASVLPALLPDLDPAHNVIAAAAMARRGSEKAISVHAQPIGDNLRVLLGGPTGAQTANALPLLHDALTNLTATVVIDCGRVASPAASLYNAADQRLLLTRPTRHDLLALAELHRAQAAAASETRTVIVGNGPYHDTDLNEVGIAVAVTKLPHDPKAADAALGQRDLSAKKYTRRPLVRAIDKLTRPLVPTSLLPGPAIGPTDHTNADAS